MLPLQKPKGVLGNFSHVPINSSSHPLLFYFTHHIVIYSRLCTKLIHNITKVVYYSRHIPDISTRHHHIPDMFQCRNQYQFKYKEMDIFIPHIKQLHIPVAWVLLSPICLTHIGGHYVIPLNITGHIGVYMLLPYPGYSQSIPITSFPYKCFSVVPSSHGLNCLVFFAYTCPCI